MKFYRRVYDGRHKIRPFHHCQALGTRLGGREFEVARVAPESEKQMQIGQVLPLIFIPYTYLGSKKKPLAFILAFKKSVIFLKSGRKSCFEKLLQLRLLK